MHLEGCSGSSKLCFTMVVKVTFIPMLTNKSELWKLYAHCLTSRVQSGCMADTLITRLTHGYLCWAWYFAQSHPTYLWLLTPLHWLAQSHLTSQWLTPSGGIQGFVSHIPGIQQCAANGPPRTHHWVFCRTGGLDNTPVQLFSPCCCT